MSSIHEEFTSEERDKFDEYIGVLFDTGVLLNAVTVTYEVNELYSDDEIDAHVQAQGLEHWFDSDYVCNWVSENYTVNDVFDDGWIWEEGICEESPEYWYGADYMAEWAWEYTEEARDEYVRECVEEWMDSGDLDDRIEERLTSGELDDMLVRLGWEKKDEG